MQTPHPWLSSGLGAAFAIVIAAPIACSGSGNTASKSGGASDAAQSTPTDSGSGPGATPDGGASDDSGAVNPGDASGTVPVGDAGTFNADGGYPAGWLYTSGGKIYESGGASGGTPWMGRGVNTDDIFLCGYDDSLWMTSPGMTVETIVSGIVSGWKPNFIRMSLAMDSYGTSVSWLSDPSKYATPMTAVINAIGTYPGVHVLVTLRSDASMIGQDTADGDPEATGLPSDSTTTPNATMFPTGTDATYVALVDAFAHASFVMFGLTNEPGGNKLSDATIAAAMSHAVGTIRAEEDRLGVPHHLVSVQGNGWTSDISFYATTPIAHDNVVYEVHGYPPTASSYTYSNIPVILGEYGSLTDSTTFYADVESKQIPNLAWDFDPYSNCAPDLVSVTTSDTTLTPTAWGMTVQSYLLAHQ
ncbi:MAG: cellulase family glycosylhydrolase [Polyangiaceae bacterium]